MDKQDTLSFHSGFIIEIIDSKLFCTRDRNTVNDSEHYDFSPADVTKRLVKDVPMIIKSSLDHSFTIILSTSGRLWVWGNNKKDYLGLGLADTKFIHRPMMIIGPRFVSFSCGVNHSCAIDEGGWIWSWGCNEYQQLGNQSLTGIKHPVTSKFRATLVSCGEDFTSCFYKGIILIFGKGYGTPIEPSKFQINSVDQLESNFTDTFVLSEGNVLLLSGSSTKIDKLPFSSSIVRIIRGYSILVAIPSDPQSSAEYYKCGKITKLHSPNFGDIKTTDDIVISGDTVAIRRCGEMDILMI